MGGVDGGQDLARARAGEAGGAVEQAGGLGDQVAAPEADVLPVGRDHGAQVVQAGGPARLGEADQGGQAQHLGLARHQLGQQAREAQDLGGEAGGLPGQGGVLIGLGVGDLERGQHRLQPFRPGLAARNLEGYAGVADLALGPGDPLQHGGLRDQEGPGQPLGG